MCAASSSLLSRGGQGNMCRASSTGGIICVRFVTGFSCESCGARPGISDETRDGGHSSCDTTRTFSMNTRSKCLRSARVPRIRRVMSLMWHGDGAKVTSADAYPRLMCVCVCMCARERCIVKCLPVIPEENSPRLSVPWRRPVWSGQPARHRSTIHFFSNI